MVVQNYLLKENDAHIQELHNTEIGFHLAGDMFRLKLINAQCCPWGQVNF